MPGVKYGARTKENLLTPTERDKLLKACKTFDEKFVVYGLLYTGMRVSEFLHMRRDWIDFEGGWIKIPSEQPCNCRACLRQRNGIWRVKSRKGEYKGRRIKLPPEVKPLFEEFFRKRRSVLEVYRNRMNLWRIVKQVGKRAGIKRLFPHVLRGTHASMLAGKGFSPWGVQAALGWKSIKTADYYIRISPDMLEREYEEKW